VTQSSKIPIQTADEIEDAADMAHLFNDFRGGIMPTMEDSQHPPPDSHPREIYSINL
jgi:hypothetical protein